MKKHLVVLTGAGISAESGLKTFRDADGLWNGYDIQEVATPRAFLKNPQLVLDFYNMRRRDVLNALPNAAHLEIASWQNDFHVSIVTQNIDDLHERAGSKNVLHLHGEILKMRSILNEHAHFDIQGDIHIGDKASDGGQLRPHIVWFEEPVPLIETAADIVADADLFVLIGTSLQVYPAAGLVHYAGATIPKFVIDKLLPPTGKIANCTFFEMEATKGVKEVSKMLADYL